MNARQELMCKIGDLTEDENIADAVKDFVDEMERKFCEIEELLSGVNIHTLESIGEARDIANDTAHSIY